MTLTATEAERFFRLWHELMYFVDQQTGGEQQLAQELSIPDKLRQHFGLHQPSGA